MSEPVLKMTEQPDLTTCGTCRHWVRFGEESTGECYLNPPIPLASGGKIRPRCTVKEKGCSRHQEGPPQVRVKVTPETPGTARKAAQKAKAVDLMGIQAGTTGPTAGKVVVGK